MIEKGYKETSGKYSNPEMNTFRDARVGADVVRNNSIATEVTDLRDLVSQAHELFTILEQRTEPFRQRTPQMQEKDTTITSAGSEIRANLADQNEHLRALIRRISIVIDEIDL